MRASLRPSLILPLVPLVLVASACSAPDSTGVDHGVARGSIIQGERDDAYPAVVTLINYGTDPKNVTSCTGTVITPHVVLTAAHCVFPAVTGPVAETYVFVGNDSTDKAQTDDRSKWFVAKETRFHPGYKGAAVAGRDVGVVITKDAMSVRPMRFRSEPLTLELVKGQPMVALGYGLTTASDPASGGVRTRREASVGNLLNEDLLGVTKGTLCHGDSGGPLVWRVNGVNTLIGIHAFVSSETCSAANYSTRPDIYAADYISPIAEEFDPGYLANFPPEDVDAGGVVAQDAGVADAASNATPATPAVESGCSMHASVPGSGTLFGVLLGLVALIRRVTSARR